MSITEELREYANSLAGMLGASVTDVKGALEEIADRIDAKLEDHIPLPKDADGKTIRIGDEVEVIGRAPGIVAGIQLNERGWDVAVRPHGWDTPTVYDSESIRHAKPDSWERIIRDAQADGVRYHNDGRLDFAALKASELQAENAKLRELVNELWVSCPVHDSDCDDCKHKGGRTGCELYDRIRELEVDA